MMLWQLLQPEFGPTVPRARWKRWVTEFHWIVTFGLHHIRRYKRLSCRAINDNAKSISHVLIQSEYPVHKRILTELPFVLP